MIEDIKYKRVEGEIPVSFSYTYGLAGEKFFRALYEERFLFASCSCGEKFIPPKIYCENCYSAVSDFVEFKGKMFVKSFTINYRDDKGNILEEPKIVVLVGFEGISGGIISILKGADKNKVHIGMTVKPIFKEKSKREYSITDVSFEPA